MSQYVERDTSTIADFEEVARVLKDDHVSPVINSALPSAGKTPARAWRKVELAATVDGGKGFCAQIVSTARGYLSFSPMLLSKVLNSLK